MVDSNHSYKHLKAVPTGDLTLSSLAIVPLGVRPPKGSAMHNMLNPIDSLEPFPRNLLRIEQLSSSPQTTLNLPRSQ